MKSTQKEILSIFDELTPEKKQALLYFAEWLSEEDELTPEEILALARGKEQFAKGEYVFLEDI
ncbi:MAG: hypothetical protein ACP5G4_02995 [bacterium]